MKTLHLNYRSLSRIISFPSKKLLATFGGRSVFILSYLDELKILIHFIDEDPKENFLCGTFYIENKKIKLALSGESGIIKLLNVNEHKIEGYLRQHGGKVYDLKGHPKDSSLLFSCSEDMTVRMWDVVEKRCLAIFGGYIGHKDHILSIDISLCGKKLVSAGTDCVIKIWNIPEKTDFLQLIYFPIYSSSKIHKSYISCVKFHGLLIVSKSHFNRISIICPETKTVIYKSFINSDSFFISDFTHSSNFKDHFDLKNNKIVLCTQEKEILLLKLDNLEDDIVTKKKRMNVGVKDVVLADECIYLLDENSVVMKI